MINDTVSKITKAETVRWEREEKKKKTKGENAKRSEELQLLEGGLSLQRLEWKLHIFAHSWSMEIISLLMLPDSYPNARSFLLKN